MEQVPPLEHLEALARERIDAHRNVHRQEAIARDEANKRTEYRLAQLNELRAEVLTDRSRFVNREVFDAKIQSIDIRIDALHDQITEWRGRGQGLSFSASVVVGFVGFASTVLAIYFALAN